MTKEALNDVSKEDVAIGLGIVAIVALGVDGARWACKKIYKKIKHSKKHHKDEVVSELKEAATEAAEAVEEMAEKVAEKVEAEVVEDPKAKDNKKTA